MTNTWYEYEMYLAEIWPWGVSIHKEAEEFKKEGGLNLSWLNLIRMQLAMCHTNLPVGSGEWESPTADEGGSQPSKTKNTSHVPGQNLENFWFSLEYPYQTRMANECFQHVMKIEDEHSHSAGKGECYSIKVVKNLKQGGVVLSVMSMTKITEMNNMWNACQ